MLQDYFIFHRTKIYNILKITKQFSGYFAFVKLKSELKKLNSSQIRETVTKYLTIMFLTFTISEYLCKTIFFIYQWSRFISQRLEIFGSRTNFLIYVDKDKNKLAHIFYIQALSRDERIS